MSVALLDVNVLIALFDPAHLHHDAAHAWLGPNRKSGWATCPLTLNGCLRVFANPKYPTVQATPTQVIEKLRTFCADSHHHFWPDSIAVTDPSLFHSAHIAGPQQVTDIYLLGLAVANHGKLVTFDRSIAIKAVSGALPKHLIVLSG